MMTTTEILNEIYKLPLTEQTNIKKSLLAKAETTNEVSKQDLWQKLFEEGLITHVPNGVSDEEDDFEPIEITGEPISETIIRERR
ncbi:MAG: hypothetical protein M3Q78_06570 [Acidobacteriota bacterium]|jgi:hypothetical protein|nr:hypothetical protein [Acidobacteriota bacterium]